MQRYLVLFFLFLLALSTNASEKKTFLFQFDLRHTEPRGVGFYEGYTTLEAFWLASPYDRVFPYADFRASIFNNGRPAFNTGIGMRKKSGDRFYGGNVYWDYRNVTHKNFNQISLGFESIGWTWDVFANGYIGLGSSKSHPYGARFGGFEGHDLLVKQSIQEAFSGADAIARVHFLKRTNWDLFLDFGSYYFSAPFTKNLFGGTVSLSAKIADYFFVQANTSYDKVFKWLGQGTVGINIPLGRQPTKCPVFERRREQIPAHREIIVVDRHRKFSPAIDPATGQPFFFVFVDNNANSNGTFESPFHALADAQNASSPYNVIYVFQGDGTTTNMNQGITLQNFQQLLGSGIAYSIPTTLGTITIPQLTSGYPVITNVNGDAVTLANNNTVSGMNIDSPFGEGIVGLGTSNVTITNNLISHVNVGNASSAYAIDLEGPGLVGNHLVSGNTTFQTDADNDGGGIYFQPGTDGSPAVEDVCTMTISNNQIQANDNGIDMNSDFTICTLNIFNNTIATDGGQGINMQPHVASELTLFIQGNVVSRDGGVAFGIQPRDLSNINATVISNQFINSQKGVQIESGGSNGVVMSTLIGNQFSNNTVNDFLGKLSGSDTNTLCFSLINNNAPQLGYAVQNNQTAVDGFINLTLFENNVGTLTITSTGGSSGVTENPTCP